MDGQSNRSAFLRNYYRDKTTDGSLAAAGTGIDPLIVCRAGYSLFIQLVTILLETPAAQSVTMRSDTTTVSVAYVPASAGTGTFYRFDWGEEGKKLPESEDLVLATSGAGNVLEFHIEGYERQTSGSIVPSQV